MDIIIPDSLLHRCFGWSSRVWARPFRQFLNEHPQLHVSRALEIGADVHSSLSPLLLYLADEVQCSYFNADALPAICERNKKLIGPDRIEYAFQDITAIRGKWDLIVCKSVLGGVFRKNNSSIADVRALAGEICRNSLENDGMFVVIENGLSILEKFLKKFGARKNQWRFFEYGDFPEAEEHYSFGVLSAFALSMRFKGGRFAEHMLYALDCLLSPLISRHSVHVWVFKERATDQEN